MLSFLIYFNNLHIYIKIEYNKGATMTKKEPVFPTIGNKRLTNFNANRLRALIKEGKTCTEIMQELGLKHKQVLKHYLLKLISIDKVFYEITGLYERNNRKCYVNSKGQILFKMNNIDFKKQILRPDIEFHVKVDGAKIILTNLAMEEVKDDEDDALLSIQDSKEKENNISESSENIV